MRNNPDVAQKETAPSKAFMGTLKKAVEDALLLHGSRDFPDLAAYRGFIDEVADGRARNGKPIEARSSHPDCQIVAR
jgi:hypothetical protein